MDYVAPAPQQDAFNCPHCSAYAQMRWVNLSDYGRDRPSHINQATCLRCQKNSYWHIRSSKPLQMKMIYPSISTVPLPAKDMPDDCRPDYEEARAIAAQSPRAAAALLRLVVEKLCHQLGDPSKDINQNIALLVQNGLPKRIQQALDSVRVIGNASLHPGIMDIEDKQDTVTTLFKLVNIIVEKMISEPKEIDDVFECLPESRKQGIAIRDKPKP
ncbi:DUF4145 domain-containing protein [Chromobacterium alkanivorans]|uniref:DUF4145 domain-containing protein n=1 Tax=Chromobacterium alkanivorans TaxID=1071719 RepID=UPI0019676FE1|nr:DUF4145 domain-containing protein [Chromobacterium alkanivorans]MBN3006395.1 DUF4145 domain-containing protein [Chromobacterium alkanivorans]